VAAVTATVTADPSPLKEITATALAVVSITPQLAAQLKPPVAPPSAQLTAPLLVVQLQVAKLPDKDVTSLSILRSQSLTEDQGGIVWPPDSSANRFRISDSTSAKA
jgi:hypothetical protein